MKLHSLASGNDQQGTPRVLIAEDNEDKRVLLKSILDKHYQVFEAEDGNAALTLVVTIRPEVVLLDVLMPGIDGFEVCRRMKANPQTADIPVLFVSVLDPDQHVVEGLRLGGEDFISWPVSSTELVARIQARIRSHRPLSELRTVVQQQSRHLEENRRRNAVTQRELEEASKVQQRFITNDFPEGRALRFAHKYRPSGKVGGDLLDIVSVRDKEVAIMVADVSGHGVAAALLTGVAKVLFRVGAEQYREPCIALNWLNRQMCGYLGTGEFLTIFLAFWNAETQTLSYAGAGHPPALWVRPRVSSVEFLEVNPGIVGVRPDAVFTGSYVHLGSGHRIVCYTDGIIDAMNPESHLFGEENLAAKCLRLAGLPIDQMVECVFDEIDRFVGRETQQDDQALLVLEVDR
jgi:serine phosphatase RsbU (regulator of sigma subunit)